MLHVEQAVRDGAELLSAGVDYVRLITTDSKESERVKREYHSWAYMMRELGYDEKSFGMQGYRGLTIAGVAYGERDADAITQASGVYSEPWWYTARGEPWRASRMDLHITAKFADDVPGFASWSKEGAVHARSSTRGGTPRRIILIDGCGGGDTLSVGSRVSEKYGRVYDKHRESAGEYEKGTWRWEVEYKGVTGAAVERTLREARVHAPVAESLVRGFFEERGVSIPIRVSVPSSDIHLGYAKTDNERRLAWLEKHVRPTIERLCKAGLESEARAALGLT